MLFTPPDERGPNPTDRLRQTEHWCEVVVWLCQNHAGDYMAGDLRTRLAVYHSIGVIADVSKDIDETTRDSMNVNWRRLQGMRVILVHRPWKVNPNTVWLAATRSVPNLLAELRRVAGRVS